MHEKAQGESLQVSLEELCALFASLRPDLKIAAAIGTSAGELIARAGQSHVDFRPIMKRPASPTAARGVEFVSPQEAVSPISSKAAFPQFDLHVWSEPSAGRQTLEGFCKIGATLLGRTIELSDQTRKLRQRIREQEAIIDHISDGLIVLDRSGTLRYLNAPGGRILNLAPENSIGRRFRDLLDFEPYIAAIFETGEGYIDRELHIQTRKVNVHVMDTAIPIVGEDGQVMSVVNTFREMARVTRLSNRLVGDRARYRFSDIIGHSQVIKDTIAQARRAARSDVNVLLYGESGTGKEVFAQSIHNDGSRATGPFVAINCAALPRDLIESEMFGYAAGSFTGADKAGRPGRFELASGGTIFLDEVSEMPLDVQAKLLRVLQERQVTRIGGTSSINVDVRVVAAANQDLRVLVAQRAFREDLYYRLNVVRIDLPPLRERREDIARLTDESIRSACAALHRPTLALGAKVLRQLEEYRWPGNVRQLQNVIERLVNMTDADKVTELPSSWSGDHMPLAQRDSPQRDIGETMSLDEATVRAIRLALQATDLNLSRTAELLGITRPTLYAKMKKYGLETGKNLMDAGADNLQANNARVRN